MDNSRIIKTLRAQAWARAKGELEAVLNSYWDEEKVFGAMQEATDSFVKHVEDEGLVE